MQSGGIKSLLATTVFFTAFIIFSMVYMPVAILITVILALPAALTPVGHQWVGRRLTRWFIRGYGQTVVRLAFPWVRFQFSNRCDLPLGTPCIFISNHQSIADIFLMAYLPMRQYVFLSNQWPFKIPVLGFFAWLAGFLNLETSNPDEVFERVGKLVSDKISIISFPEGTRTRTGKLGAFHTTVFRIAQQIKIPIVPVCLEGTFRTFPRNRAMICPGRVQLHVLPSLHPDSYLDLSPYQLKQRVQEIITLELAAMEGVAA